MRALPFAFLAVLLLAPSFAEAQTSRSRAPGAVPPIMVEDEARPGRRAAPPRKARKAERRPPRGEARRVRERIAIPERTYIPLPSRSSEVGSINRSLGTQGQLRNLEQQNQFEVNQLRQQIQRNQLSPIGGFGGSPGCPAGSIGC